MNLSNKKQLISGRHPVVEAIERGTPFDKLILQQGVRGDFEKEIRQLSKAFNIPLQVVPKERLSKLVRGNHQGIVGLISLITYNKLEDVLPLVYENSEIPLFVILDGITDVRNMGAIARSAECCGVNGLIIGKKGNAPINAEAIKSSAGALMKIPVCRENSLVNAVEYLQHSGIKVLASDLKADKMIYDVDLTGPAALIIGAEGPGVSKALLEKSDESFIIPQKGETDSFNASVATGIMLYEVLRQRAL